MVHVASGREWRGGERQVLILARALARLGVDQVVVTRREGRLARELRANAIPVDPVGWKVGLSPAALVAATRDAKNGDLLHAHDGHSVTIAAVAARLASRPFVVTRRLDRPLVRRGFWASAARIIAISEAVRASLVASGIPEDRVTVIPSGIELSPARTSQSPDRGAGPATIVSIGALTPEKGHFALLDVAARLAARHPDLRWAVAGGGPLRGPLEVAARRLGVDSKVRFLGEIENPTELLSGATLFVSCSVQEALGTSILDAMAAGLPVVATRVGGVPELLAGGAGVLVDQGNTEAMADAIDWLLCDPRARQDVSREGSRRVERFSADRMATEVLAVYRSVPYGR